MQLDRIEAVVRPRNPWESMDLGFSMVRLWWKPLFKIWFAFVLPFFFIGLFLFEDNLWIAGLIFWWAKPIYDRILLYFFSNALFGEQPAIWHCVKGLFKTRLFLALTFSRFDLARSFNLPIWQLEKLQGKSVSPRYRLLQRHSRGTAIWLTIVCIHFEWLLSLSLFGLLYLMLPVPYSFDFFAVLFFEETAWVEPIRLFFDVLVIGIVESLYVAAGFSLYLNARTHLEAWDIELAFRRIAAHLQNRS